MLSLIYHVLLSSGLLASASLDILTCMYVEFALVRYTVCEEASVSRLTREQETRKTSTFRNAIRRRLWILCTGRNSFSLSNEIG